VSVTQDEALKILKALTNVVKARAKAGDQYVIDLLKEAVKEAAKS
jgi:hypothetical protein